MEMAVAPLTVDVHLTARDRFEALRRDALAGLSATPKELPPKWFYDERGSQLFDQITRLPEYYLTRAEREILEAVGADVAALSQADTLVEIGSGTSRKTRILLDALRDRDHLERFVPFDVSEAVLRQSAEQIAAEYPHVGIHAVVGDFEQHLSLLPRGGRRLVAFLGSSIGNLGPRQRARFLAALHATLRPGDWLLLGTDLVKEAAVLQRAYDDRAGVTAEFNLNVLRVLNRELGADFDIDRFEHVARWDARHERVEMYLRSTGVQTVRVAALELAFLFARHELMRTEISTKFRRDGVERELRTSGFQLARWWEDAGGRFAVSLSSAGSKARSRASNT